MEKKFVHYAANEDNPKWERMTIREEELYQKPNESRTEFGRDHSRILFSNSYRRLKNKTQVFFSPKDDHICTRIEHVNNVECVSYNIANCLGLNTELTRAIAIAHDLGHAPFGHKGEKVLSNISKEELGEKFWHEKNGLYLVDNIELLENTKGKKKNLNLTYAVRDGIISHCGEIDENALKPREEFIDLANYTKPNEYAPFTWEACVVKIADKISYLGRDIEDAISLGILEEQELDELRPLFNYVRDKINNTVIISTLIGDLINNSSVEKGLVFSENCFNMISTVKKFNYFHIYQNKRLAPSDRYFNYVIREIYQFFVELFDGENTWDYIQKYKKYYPKIVEKFIEWLEKYIDLPNRKELELDNKIVYNICDKKDYIRAVITYISGMTDNYAIETYYNIVSF